MGKRMTKTAMAMKTARHSARAELAVPAASSAATAHAPTIARCTEWAVGMATTWVARLSAHRRSNGSLTHRTDKLRQALGGTY